MRKKPAARRICAVCGRDFPAREVVGAALVHPPILQRMQAEKPEVGPESFICRDDLARHRAAHVRDILESERGELTSLEREVVESLQRHEMLASDPDSEAEQRWSFGERVADRIASFGGSWPFIFLFAAFAATWIALNSLGGRWAPLDPFPYILLNLLLSCLAAVQAPVIMMSQNRQAAKDRMAAALDYEVNLKSELSIAELHTKLDRLQARLGAGEADIRTGDGAPPAAAERQERELVDA